MLIVSVLYYLQYFSKNIIFQYDSFLTTSQYAKSKHLIHKHNVEFDFDIPGKLQFPTMKRDFYVILTNSKTRIKMHHLILKYVMFTIITSQCHNSFNVFWTKHKCNERSCWDKTSFILIRRWLAIMRGTKSQK